MEKEVAGSLAEDELKNFPGYPSAERLKKGAVVIIECPEEIPCDVCEAVCPFDAIVIGKEVKNLPKIVEEKCQGCGLCIPKCPGLAIYTVDMTYSKDRALLSFPYEFQPLPEVGSTVRGTTRSGRESVEVKVIDVQQRKDYDRTTVISIAVPKDYIDEIRGIALDCQ